MKKEDLNDAFDKINDTFIEEAIEVKKDKRGKVIAMVSVAACFTVAAVICGVIFFGNLGNSPNQNTNTPVPTEKTDEGGNQTLYLDETRNALNIIISEPAAWNEKTKNETMPSATESPMTDKELDASAELLQKYGEIRTSLFGEKAYDIQYEYNREFYMIAAECSGTKVFPRYNVMTGDFYVRSGNGKRLIAAVPADEGECIRYWYMYDEESASIMICSEEENTVGKTAREVLYLDFSSGKVTDSEGKAVFEIKESTITDNPESTPEPVPTTG